MNKPVQILIPSLLIGLIAAFVLQVRPFSPAAPFRLQVRVHSDTAGRATLFWQSERKTVLPDSDVAPVSTGEQLLSFNLPDTSTGTFHLRRHPKDAITAFRLNPLDRPGKLTFIEVKLLGPDDETVATFPPSAFKPTRADLALTVNGGSVVFATQPGEGVFVVPQQPIPLARVTVPIRPRLAALQFGGAALATWLALVMAGLIPAGTRARLAGTLAKMRDDQAAWPAATLFVAAALATAASCYPVIFFGKSFISPNYGPTHALYQDFPSLPQSPHEIIEPSRGADTGAALWGDLPYSVIQHRSIFEHGELPLWNRYAYCGLPLLGQGQSMLGDPLHWIPIAAGGSVWSWDVKFCIAKLLFSFGIGLLVFAATRRIWLASLLVISSSFIGYFAYRFNHCAYFSLCYSPWILLCWLRAARTAGRVWPWALALAAANFWELNSGTAKESAMLIAGLNFTGGLLVLTAERRWRERLTRLAMMNFGNLLFVLIAAPHWMVFLDAMRHAWILPTKEAVFQIQPSLVLGLFDDLFYSQTTNNELLFNPGTNFLVLLGCLWAAADLRRLLRDRVFLAVLLGALLPAAMVFGVVPPGFIARIPFIGAVAHVDDIFSTVLITHLPVLAAFGLRSLWDSAAKEHAPGDAMIPAVLLALLVALFLGYTQAAHRGGAIVLPHSLLGPGETMKMGGFFLAYAAALIAAVLVMPRVVRSLRHRPCTGSVILGGLCLFAFHFRHGLWTGTKFDRYVMNPPARSDLAAGSPAVAAIRAAIERSGEPARVTGVNAVLAPGFNVVTGLEHFMGPDALVNPWQRELTEKSGMPNVWGWRYVMRRGDFPRAQVFGDLWNVRWYLGAPDEPPAEVNGLTLLTTLDLQIYASPSAWPRAFFTDRLAECSSLDDFVALLGATDGRPLAALVPERASDAPPAMAESLAARSVLPASEYRLTENSAAFTISAPTPGVAVLGNSFESGNWRVTLDGRPVDYFRVNHAFLGVRVPEPGIHKLRFVYWPRLLTPALWISLGGLLLALGTVFVGMRRKTPASGEPETHPVETSAGTPSG